MTLASASPRSTDSLSTTRSLQRLHLKRNAQRSTPRISTTASWWRADSRFAIHLWARRDDLPENADAMKRQSHDRVTGVRAAPAERRAALARAVGRRSRTCE